MTSILPAFAEGIHINRRAINLSLLSNISGKSGKFQGNDWVVELINLHTKVSNFLLYVSSSLIDITQGYIWWKIF